jgi:hypothetical protein
MKESRSAYIGFRGAGARKNMYMVLAREAVRWPQHAAELHNMIIEMTLKAASKDGVMIDARKCEDLWDECVAEVKGGMPGCTLADLERAARSLGWTPPTSKAGT